MQKFKYEPFPANLEEAFDIAYNAEILAYNLYIKIAEVSQKSEIAVMAEKLAAQEKTHCAIIVEIYENILGKRFEKDTTNLVNEESNIPNYNRVTDLLQFALEKEQDAFNFYMNIYNSCKEEKVREFLRKLANDEKEHQKEIERLM